jgi:hypothetical protein
VSLHGVLVTGGEHRDSSLLAERGHAKSGRRNGQRNDRDVQLPCSHRVGKLEPRPRLHRRLEVGRVGDETPQSSGDAGQESRGDVADPQHTARPVAGAAGRQPCRLCLAEHSVCLREHGGPCVREGNVAVRAVEQPHPELVLELADLL